VGDRISTTLGEVVAAGNGKIQTGPFGSQLHASDYVDAGIPCIMPTNMKNNRVNLTDIAFIAEKDAKRLSQHLVQEGDIVYSRRGDVTQKALIREGEAGYFCGTGCLLVRPGTAIDPEFLTYHLSTPSNRTWIVNQAVGAHMANLNTGILSKAPLCIPNEAEQKKIAAVLSALDTRIDLNNRINAELEALAKTIYDYWFVQFDFPDAHGRPYKSSGGAMVWNDTLKREIPAEWEVVSLGELVDVVKEGVASDGADTTTPYVGLEHIARKSIVLSEWSTADQAASQKTAFRSGDILFGKIRPYFHKVALASIDGISSTDAIVIRPKRPEVSGLVLETVFAERFVAMATASSTGSKMPRADWNVMKRYGMAVPDKHSNTLSKYQDLFGPIADKIGLHVRQNRELTQLRDWLLPLLMNGQVRVA
jgi:type I restriction enzyme S subunit